MSLATHTTAITTLQVFAFTFALHFAKFIILCIFRAIFLIVFYAHLDTQSGLDVYVEIKYL